MTKILFLFILLLPLASISQVTIRGRILNLSDAKPVPDVSVFLSNATIGGKTGADGTFSLQNVKPGKYELAVSIIGFDTYNKTITVGNIDINLPDIMIYPKAIALNEVKIKPQSNPDRKRNYEWFRDEFLGTSALAKECKILNPEMLDLSYDEKTSTLTASSVDFLVIQNDALGYKIKYLLKDFMLNNEDGEPRTFSFSGSVLFETLKGSPEQEQQWQKRRREVYEGSQVHFLRSALADRIEQEGFRVLRLPANPKRPADSIIQEKLRIYSILKDDKKFRDSLNYWTRKSNLPKTLDKLVSTPLTNKDIINGPDKQGLYTLSSNNDALFITYNQYHHFNRSVLSKLSDPENKDNTLLSFNSPKVLFDRNGSVTNPKSLTYDGVWVRNRLAGLLPLDYEPQEENITGVESTLIKNISSKLNNYTAGHAIEKAYLQFDKPYYAGGDTIYFKAYVTRGEKHELTQLSSILQVDLIINKQISRSIKLQLTDGLAWGDFALADTLKEGNYYVRAYTQWMRNEGEDSFFEQPILVGSTSPQKVAESGVQKSLALRQKGKSNQSDVQFMPEGGNIIADRASKIAFKAIGPDGMGTAIKGTVTDDAGNEICAFKSAHLGMGAFTLIPEAGKTYKANVTFEDGATRAIDLPRAVSNGYTLNINNSSADTIRIRITAGRESTLHKLSLVAQSGGTIYYTAQTRQKDAKFLSVVIPKNKFPTGIVQFTLFSATGEPLNERLAFIQHNDRLKLDLNTEKHIYTTREKVKIILKAKNKEDKAVQGSFSVAVTDETKVPVDTLNESNILSNILLTSELKGNIEQPAYYFNNNDEKTSADLDNLLLTQGYRHFEWKQALADVQPSVKYWVEKAVIISGTVKKNGKPAPNAKVILFSKARGAFMLDTLTDNNGRFAFKELVFADSTRFVVQSKVAKGQDDITLELDTVSLPPVVARINQTNVQGDSSRSVYIENAKAFYREQQKYGINKHAIALKEVKIEAKKERLIPHSVNLNGSGNADQVFGPKDVERMICGRLVDCLQGMIASVYFDAKGYPKNRRTGSYMAIVIDGNFVGFGDFLDLRPDDIEGIEVVLGPQYGAIYGSRMAYGGFIITTKRGSRPAYSSEAPGVTTCMPKGFYKAREFYSPQYDNPKTNRQMADLRSTIYWQPNVVTDKNGNASFSYFNADNKGTYRLVIEGIDADGNLGRQVIKYRVE